MLIDMNMKTFRCTNYFFTARVAQLKREKERERERERETERERERERRSVCECAFVARPRLLRVRCRHNFSVIVISVKGA